MTSYFIYPMAYADTMPSLNEEPDANNAIVGFIGLGDLEEPVADIIDYVYKLVDKNIISKDYAIRFGVYNSGTEYVLIRDLVKQQDYLALG